MTTYGSYSSGPAGFEHHQQPRQMTAASGVSSGGSYSHPPILPPVQNSARYFRGYNNPSGALDTPRTPLTPQNLTASTSSLPYLNSQSAVSGANHQHSGSYATVSSTEFSSPTSPNYSIASTVPSNMGMANGSFGGHHSLPHLSSQLYSSHGNSGMASGFDGSASASVDYQDTKNLPIIGSQALSARRSQYLPLHGRTSSALTAGLDQQGARNPVIPMKNSDGKYVCSYCNKTYLHLKHLKRHHLRHTGERPYQCSLCHETFCRSDILKRHFQKCAIRRGNPNGVGHLTHAQDHIKGNGSQSHQSMSSLPPISSHLANPPYGTSLLSTNSPSTSSGINTSGASGLGSSESSRSSSEGRPGSSGSEDRRFKFDAPPQLISTQSGSSADYHVYGAHHHDARQENSDSGFETRFPGHMPRMDHAPHGEHSYCAPQMAHSSSGSMLSQSPAHAQQGHFTRNSFNSCHQTPANGTILPPQGPWGNMNSLFHSNGQGNMIQNYSQA